MANTDSFYRFLNLGIQPQTLGETAVSRPPLRSRVRQIFPGYTSTEISELSRVIQYCSEDFNPLGDILESENTLKSVLFQSVIFKYLANSVNVVVPRDLKIVSFLYDENFEYQCTREVYYYLPLDKFIDRLNIEYTYAIPYKMSRQRPYSTSEYLEEYFPATLPSTFFETYDVRAQLTEEELQRIETLANVHQEVLDNTPVTFSGLTEARAPWYRQQEDYTSQVITDHYLRNTEYYLRNRDQITFASVSGKPVSQDVLEKIEDLCKKKFKKSSGIQEAMETFSDLFRNMSDLLKLLDFPHEELSDLVPSLDALKDLFDKRDPKVLRTILSVSEVDNPKILKNLRDQTYTFCEVSCLLKTGSLHNSLKTLTDLKMRSLVQSS